MLTQFAYRSEKLLFVQLKMQINRQHFDVLKLSLRATRATAIFFKCL